VMFFSFSSAIVIFILATIHLNPFTQTYSFQRFREIFKRRVFEGRQHITRQADRAALCSPPLCLSKIFRLRQHVLPFSTRDPVKHPIHSFLDSGAGPVELPRGLGGELA
jgi:hypothetical protein